MDIGYDKRYMDKPNRNQMFDTEHPDIDDAIYEASDRLNAGFRAWYDYDALNEKYLHLRSRVESGRLPRYANPLGVKADSSGGGSDGMEDAMVDLVEWAKKDLNSINNLWQVQREVTDLIHKACRTKTGKINWRIATVLECRYAHFLPMPYQEIAETWPQYFWSKSAAQWAENKGEAMVAQYVLDQRLAAVSASV